MSTMQKGAWVVQVKRWRNTISQQMTYYAEIRDPQGRLRAAGNRRDRMADAEKDAFVFFQNIPAE